MIRKDSETFLNLARAYAGECQAGMRYQFMAQQAMERELYQLADAIKEIAKNETVHARAFYDEIVTPYPKDLKIGWEGDYPFYLSSLEENLKFASHGEREEHEVVYRSFSETAKKEGYDKIAALFSRIGEIEKNHEIVFSYLATALSDGTLYMAQHPVVWRCSECGYLHTAKEAWKTCPVCGKVQGYVKLFLPFEGEKG